MSKELGTLILNKNLVITERVPTVYFELLINNFLIYEINLIKVLI